MLASAGHHHGAGRGHARPKLTPPNKLDRSSLFSDAFDIPVAPDDLVTHASEQFIDVVASELAAFNILHHRDGLPRLTNLREPW
jgi:hypothetical protein